MLTISSYIRSPYHSWRNIEYRRCRTHELEAALPHLRDNLANQFLHLKDVQPIYRNFRAGDVRHSQADMTKARERLGYQPSHQIHHGLADAMEWYVEHY